MADALGSVVVIFSGLLVKYVDQDIDSNWKFYVDPTLSIFLSIFIMFSVLPLFKESCVILMQSVPSKIDVDTLRNKIQNINFIANLKSFHVWSLNSEIRVASAHIRVTKFDFDVYKNTINTIRCLLNSHGIVNSTFEVEFDIEKSDATKEN